MSSYHTSEKPVTTQSSRRCWTQSQDPGSNVLPSEAALPHPSSHWGAGTEPKAAPWAERTLSVHCNTLHWVLNIITPGRMVKPDYFGKSSALEAPALLAHSACLAVRAFWTDGPCSKLGLRNSACLLCCSSPALPLQQASSAATVMSMGQIWQYEHRHLSCD